MNIIAAIDIIDGKCVRLSQGDYAQKKVYSSNPLEVALSFQDAGIKQLHLVDLDGAKSSKIVNYAILEELASRTKLEIDFGGGIKSDQDIEIAFNSGASKVTGGSIAVQQADLFCAWIQHYGSDKIILGADCNNRRIATQGWLKESDLDVVDFIQFFEEQGITQVISTDIQKDGMLAGPSIDLYSEILEKTKVHLIASGGVSSLEDLKRLREINCAGVIIGKAIYEGKITLNELGKLC